MNPTHALLLIDIQNDFLPGGALAVSRGDRVIGVANELIGSFEHVIATQDWHPADHASFASQNPGISVGEVFQLGGLEQVAWPDHCVQGTKGAEMADRIDRSRIDHVVRKGTQRNIDSYSGFFDNGHRQATGLDDHLKSLGIQELTVMGLATDYCVKFTVLDAIELGYRVNVAIDGCRGVDLHPGDVDAAIQEMRSAGARIDSPDSPVT